MLKWLAGVPWEGFLEPSTPSCTPREPQSGVLWRAHAVQHTVPKGQWSNIVIQPSLGSGKEAALPLAQLVPNTFTAILL